MQTAPALAQDNGESLRRALLARLEFEELNLQLVGVSTFKGERTCYIKHPGSAEQLTYSVGDVVGGYRIASIEDQSVTFDRDGIQFWLMLGESSGGNQTGPIGDDFLAGKMAPDTQPLMKAEPAKEQLAGVMAPATKEEKPSEEKLALGDDDSLTNDEIMMKLAERGIKTKRLKFKTAKIIENGDVMTARQGKGEGGYASNGRFDPIVPIKGELTSVYGYRRHPLGGDWRYHHGIDIAGPYGASIMAADDGTVTKVTWSASLGKHIIINHGGGIETCYGHLSKQLVTAGQRVRKGELIGREGSSGWSTGPHLHFEVRKNGNWVNPQSYVKVR